MSKVIFLCDGCLAHMGISEVLTIGRLVPKPCARCGDRIGLGHGGSVWFRPAEATEGECLICGVETIAAQVGGRREEWCPIAGMRDHVV